MNDDSRLDQNVGEITLRVVRNFRGRSGFCVVATLTQHTSTSASRTVTDHEVTKQYSQADDAVEALASFVRVQSVESESD